MANLKNVFAFALFPSQDYFDIVKKPMDLSTIRKRLDTGLYTDPWEYVDHVWLMFSNAWVYNRKNSRVHKFCSKVCYNNFAKHLITTSRLKMEFNLNACFCTTVGGSVRGGNRRCYAISWILLWTEVRVQSTSSVLLWQATLHNTQGCRLLLLS